MYGTVRGLFVNVAVHLHSVSKKFAEFVFSDVCRQKGEMLMVQVDVTDIEMELMREREEELQKLEVSDDVSSSVQKSYD